MSTKRGFFPIDAAVALALAPVLLAFSGLHARGDEAEAPPQEGTAATEPESPAGEAAETPTEKAPTREEILAAIAKLDSDDFVERESTQILLWKAGALAEAALEEVVKSGSTEARFRAARVLERFRFGIYPDTPQEVVELVQGFRRGGIDERLRTIAELAKRGMFEIVRRLVETVEDEEQAEALARAAARESEEPARALIAKGDLDGAAKILRMSAVTREAMQNFATFCVLRGTADQERAAIEGGTMREKDKRELLHWLARVAGDFPTALAHAEKLEDKELARDTRIAAGDLVAFAEGAEDLRLRTLKALGFRAAVHRLKGEAGELEKTVKEIMAYAQQHRSEAAQIYTALMVNGAVDEALEVVRSANPDLAFEHLIEQEKFAEAMELKGMPGLRPPFDAWLAEQVKTFVEGDDSDEGSTSSQNLAEFSDIAGFLHARGEKEYLNRISREMAAAAAGKSGVTNLLLARYLRGIGAREAFLECADRALDKGQTLEQVLEFYVDYASAAQRWSTFLTGRRKLEPKEALRLIDAILTPDGQTTMPPEVAGMIEEATGIVNKAEPGDAEEASAWHTTLADTLGRWNQWDRAVEHLKAALPAEEGDNALLRRIASIRLFQHKWEEAATALGSLWKADGTDEGSGYLYALALTRSGRKDEGEAIMRQIELQMLGDTSRRGDIETLLWENGEVELAEKQSRLVLALGRPYNFECARSVTYLSLRLRYTDREEAAAEIMERQMLQTLKGGDYFNTERRLRMRPVPIASVSALYSVKARGLLRKGDAEGALALAEQALEFSPGDSALLEYLHPMLVEKGRKEAADALFERVYAVSRRGVELYPGYGQANNNHAWLLARCGKHLDEALRHAEKAVEIEPDSSASVDTLAEVHFARGDSAKAVEVSDRAVLLAPGDAQLREQNARFRKAAGAGRDATEATEAGALPPQ